MAEIVSSFRILSAKCLMALPKLERCQDLKEVQWFATQKLPSIVFLVSHRWETKEEPDPHHRQRKTLVHFLELFVKLAIAARSSSLSKRLELISSLEVHGVLQAALILGDTYAKPEPWTKVLDALELEYGTLTPELILERIGIWYDFMCLPQVNSNGIDDRTQEQKAEMTRTLSLLSSLCQSSCVYLLILRETGDDYESRGWCQAELGAAKGPDRHLVLRMDLIGTPISPEYFSSSEDGRELLKILKTWSAPKHGEIGWDTVRDVCISEMLSAGVKLVEGEWVAKNGLPLITTQLPPNTFASQQPLLIFMMQLPEWLAKFDRDLSLVIRAGMKHANLRCTCDDDIVTIGLMILMARHRGAPSAYVFYANALHRRLHNRHLILAHFKQRRENFTFEVQYDWVIRQEIEGADEFDRDSCRISLKKALQGD